MREVRHAASEEHEPYLRNACTQGGRLHPSADVRTRTATDEEASCTSATRDALPRPLSGLHSCKRKIKIKDAVL